MGFGDFDVVVENRDGGDHIFDVRGSRGPVPARCEQGTHSEFGNGDRGDGHVVVVIDGVVEIIIGSLGVDEKRGIEQESAHVRSSISSSPRTASRSFAQSVSRRWRRRSAFTSAPRPPLIGSSCATVLPRRTIVKCSPRCSTASRRSAKLRAASVAVTSGMESDYQMTRTSGSGLPQRCPNRGSSAEYPCRKAGISCRERVPEPRPANGPTAGSVTWRIGGFEARRLQSRALRGAWCELRLSVWPSVAPWAACRATRRMMQEHSCHPPAKCWR